MFIVIFLRIHTDSVYMWVVLIIIALILFLSASKPKKHTGSKKSKRRKVTVTLNGAKLHDGVVSSEFKRQLEIDELTVYVNMEKYFLSSSDYISERVPELMSRIKEGRNLFPFTGEPLSLEDKKKYGLPTRSKVPSDVLLFYTPAGLKHWDRGMVSRIYMHYDFMIRRQRTLEQLKRAECKHIKVVGCETYKDQLFPLSSPPPMPCNKCTKDVCNCGFVYGD